MPPRLLRSVLVLAAASLVLPSPGARGAALSPSPTLVWSKADGSNADDGASGLALDFAGNSYVSGWTNGTVTGATAVGSADAYVARYGMDGSRSWITQFGSSAADYSTAIVADIFGNTYVFGHTYGDFDGKTPQSAGDVFLVKFTNAGTEVWRKQFGSTARDQAAGIALDRSGNVYVVGSTAGAMTASPSVGETDVFVAKFSSAGSQLWIKQFGTTNDDFGYGIAVDLWGTIAVVGETQGQFPGKVETGITDAFVATFTSDGNMRWLRQENSGPDFAYNRFTSVVMDDFENIIVGGYTGGSYTGDTAVSGPTDAVVIAYNKLSARMWVRQFGTSAGDSVLAMSRTPSGNIAVAGDTQGRSYGYGGATGLGDAFVSTLSASGTLTWWRQFGTVNPDQFVGVGADRAGNVVLAGSSKGALTPGLITRGDDAVMIKWAVFPPTTTPSRTLPVGQTMRRATLVALALLTAPLGATVTFTVPKLYKSRCVVVGSAVKGLKAGTCRVTVSVKTQFGVTRTGTAALTVGR